MAEDQSNHMRHWDALKEPAPDALKKITGGNLQGKSDINPQWRYQAMTEHFGPIGIGWKWQIMERWTEEGPNGTVGAFILIHLHYKEDGEWIGPVTGLGGSMLVEKDKWGLHLNDEAYKMATTDAIGCALKVVGVAADVYRGFCDGSKYQPRQYQNYNQQQQQQAPQPQQQAPQPQQQAPQGQGVQPADTHAEYKERAEQLVQVNQALIDADPATKAWLDACMADGFYKDVFNHITNLTQGTQSNG